MNATMTLTLEQKARIAAGTLEELVTVEFRQAKQAFVDEIENTGYVMAYAYSMPRLAKAEILKTHGVYLASILRQADPLASLETTKEQYKRQLVEVVGGNGSTPEGKCVENVKAQAIVWAIQTIDHVLGQLSD